jgi:predicted phage gp36 major capsid-like protein
MLLLLLLTSPLPLLRVEWRKSEPHMRKEMSLIAAHAAWHMGEWEEMAIYIDTVDSGPGGSSSSSSASGLIGSAAAGAMSSAAAAAGAAPSGSSRFLRLARRGAAAGPAGAAAVGGSGPVGGHMSATGAFLRAVLCIKHDQHDLARLNIERARGEEKNEKESEMSKAV